MALFCIKYFVNDGIPSPKIVGSFFFLRNNIIIGTLTCKVGSWDVRRVVALSIFFSSRFLLTISMELLKVK